MSIPLKYTVSSVIGFLKGKLSLRLFQRYERFGHQYWGKHPWSRGYRVCTIDLDEDKIRKYVQWQEQQEKKAERSQLQLFE